MQRLLVLLAVALWPAGCGDLASRLCSKGAECAEDAGVDYPQQAVDECNTRLADLEQRSDDVGCLSKYGAAMRCALNKSECVDGALVGDELACERQDAAFEQCFDDP